MPSLLAPLLALVAVAAALALTLVILLQEPKAGGLAGAFGGAGEAVFGAAHAPVRRLTAGLAATWIGATLGHALLI